MNAETMLLYFLSALAQSAASFAALVGLFAVFRLQAQREELRERYRVARHLLNIESQVPKSSLDPLADIQVQQFLDDIKAREKYTYRYPAGVQRVHEELGKARRFAPELVYAASDPLKWWAAIFVCSLVLMPVSLVDWSVIGIVFVALMAVAGRALWKTGKFIQRWCLNFDDR